jgi:hypothetical protein
MRESISIQLLVVNLETMHWQSEEESSRSFIVSAIEAELPKNSALLL